MFISVLALLIFLQPVNAGMSYPGGSNSYTGYPPSNPALQGFNGTRANRTHRDWTSNTFNASMYNISRYQKRFNWSERDINGTHYYDNGMYKGDYSYVNQSCSNSSGSYTGYATVVIDNAGASISGSFQERLDIPTNAVYSGYVNANWSNVEFTATASLGNGGTPLQTWIESGATNTSNTTIVWINFPNGLPSGTTTIYVNFMNHSVLSSAGPTGEAPQLSAPYGALDNGGLVFPFYDNFSTNASLSMWIHTPNASITANNGLNITFENGNGYLVTNKSYGVGTAFDSKITYFADTAPADPDNMGYINITEPQDATGNLGWSAAVIRAACSSLYVTQVNATGEANPCGGAFGTFYTGEITFPGGVYSMQPLSHTSSMGSVDYGISNMSTIVSGDAPTYETPVGFAQMCIGQIISSLNAQWARIRNAPPGGVMPSATFNANVTVTQGNGTTCCDPDMDHSFDADGEHDTWHINQLGNASWRSFNNRSSTSYRPGNLSSN